MAYGSVNVPGDLSGKQDLITGVPGQAVGIGADGKAAARDGWSNPNLLDNWYLADPINQRGKTTYDYTTKIGYFIDRCGLYHMRATLESDGILFENKNSSGNEFNASFFIPNLTAEMQGKLYTFSILIKDNTNAVKVGFGRGTNSRLFNTLKFVTQGAHEGTTLISVTYSVNNPEPYTQCGLYAAQSASFKVLAMKLELGSQQTLAHQDANGNWVLNDSPNKVLELLKCQRYQRVFNGAKAEASSNTYLAVGVSNTETSTPTAVNFPVTLDPPMRANPSITTDDLSKIVLFPGNKAINGLSAFGPSPSENGVTALSIRCDIAGMDYPGGKIYALNLLPEGQIILDANL